MGHNSSAVRLKRVVRKTESTTLKQPQSGCKQMGKWKDKMHHWWNKYRLPKLKARTGEESYASMRLSTDPYSTPQRAKLLFQRNIRGTLPDIVTPMETRERDAEQKIYTDNRRSAKTSDIEVGDQVLVRQDKTDKFITTFHSTPHKVMHREGNSVIVQSPAGAK